MIQLLNMQWLLQVLIILLVCKEESSPPMARGIGNTFSNPLLTSGADPWVTQRDGWYYFTHTTGKNLRLYRTKRMSDLKNAEVKTVWTPPATGMNSKQIWAPEIHFLHGKWYFYYAADDGDNSNHRMWVLEHDGEDPFTGEWVDRGKLELPDDKWAIDGTAFEHNGELYFVWSGWEGSVNVSQNIYITKMGDPLTPVGARTLLSKPDFSWEKHGGTPVVNEAPQFLRRNDKLFIVYSASGCWTDDYALGLLYASAETDLLDASSWLKHPEPIFQKDPSAQAYGPGHNSFFTSPDGSEDWMVYHANPKAGQGCGGNRSPRMQRIGWRGGLPELGKPAALGAALELPSGEK